MATNIATLIDGLVSDGVWAKLDALYVLAQQNQTDALLNLIGTSYGLTPTQACLAKCLHLQLIRDLRQLVQAISNTGFNPTTRFIA